jgi:thiamine transporter ThiT
MASNVTEMGIGSGPVNQLVAIRDFIATLDVNTATFLTGILNGLIQTGAGPAYKYMNQDLHTYVWNQFWGLAGSFATFANKQAA